MLEQWHSLLESKPSCLLLQDDMLTTLSSMLTSGESALHVLKDYASQPSWQILADCWQMAETQANKRSAADGVLWAAGDESEGIVNGISVMISAGFSVVDEPYLRGLLTAIRAHLLQVCSNTQLGRRFPRASLQHQCWLTLRACSS